MMNFKNEYLSYSRLALFERCPRAFEFRYIKGSQSRSVDYLEFGSLIHATLEAYLKSLVEKEHVGPVSIDDLQTEFRKQWQASDLMGIEWFQEGIAILEKYAEKFPEFDYRKCLGLELEFNLKLDEFTLHGFIDKIEQVDKQTIDITDYKTNRILTSQENLDNDLQLSTYALVAREIFPQYQRVILSHYLLRHGVKVSTTRTVEDLDQTREYLLFLGRQTERQTEYLPKLNQYCAYCDYSDLCVAFQNALKGKQLHVCQNVNDLEQVAREYEEISAMAKILYSRKEHLSDVLKVHLMAEKEVASQEHIYSLGTMTKTKYPQLEDTVKAVTKYTDLTPTKVRKAITSIDKGKVDRLLKEQRKKLEGIKYLELENALDGLADKDLTFRLNVKKNKAMKVTHGQKVAG